MEVNKRASIKSIPYDEFKDNDTLEKIAQELNEGGANVVVVPLMLPSTGDVVTHSGH